MRTFLQPLAIRVLALIVCFLLLSVVLCAGTTTLMGNRVNKQLAQSWLRNFEPHNSKRAITALRLVPDQPTYLHGFLSRELLNSGKLLAIYQNAGTEKENLEEVLKSWPELISQLSPSLAKELVEGEKLPMDRLLALAAFIGSATTLTEDLARVAFQARGEYTVNDQFVSEISLALLHHGYNLIILEKEAEELAKKGQLYKDRKFGRTLLFRMKSTSAKDFLDPALQGIDDMDPMEAINFIKTSANSRELVKKHTHLLLDLMQSSPSPMIWEAVIELFREQSPQLLEKLFKEMAQDPDILSSYSQVLTVLRFLPSQFDRIVFDWELQNVPQSELDLWDGIVADWLF